MKWRGNRLRYDAKMKISDVESKDHRTTYRNKVDQLLY